MRFVEKQSLVRKIVRHSLWPQAVQGSMGTGEGVILGPVVTEVGDQPARGIELLAGAGAQDQPFRHFDVRRGNARTAGEGHELVIGVNERLFDLLLRGGDHGMAEAPTDLHRHQRNNLHRFAGAGRLLDKYGTIASAHISDEAGLIGTKRLASCSVQGCHSRKAETQEYFTLNAGATKGALYF